VNDAPRQSAFSESTTDDVLRRVQELDPTASREAIDRFFAEIAEALDAVRAIDTDDSTMTAAFSPFWGEESTR
jgi:hypothetical protein